MKRYIIAAISILAFAASMVSCTDHEVIRQLDDVEAYLSEHPDSALTVLDSISTAGIQGRKANARFALLYSMALDKKHIYLTSDSLIMPAVTYYRNHGTDSDRAKSWYYLGRVQQNAGEYIQATVSLTHAEKYADLAGDSFYSGMTHRAMGDIFGDTFNISESLKYYELAYSDFEKAGARKHSDYIRLDLARAYYNNDKFAECKTMCDTVIDIARTARDTVLHSECLKLYASAILNIKETPEPEKTIRIFNYIADSLKCALSFDDYFVIADAYTGDGDIKAASDIIGQLRPLVAEDRHASAKLGYSEYLLASRQKAYGKALKHFENTVAFQDSLLRVVLKQSLLSAQHDMLRRQVEDDQYRIKAKDRTITVSVISAIVIISLLCYIYYRKVKTQEKSNADYIRQIDEAVRQIRETGNLLQEKDNRIAELNTVLKNAGDSSENYKTALDDLHTSIREIHGLRLHHLDEMCSEYYIYGQTASRYRRIFKQMEALVESLSDNQEYRIIESTVNQFKQNIMAKARTDFHNLKEEDFRLLCYLYAGFSSNTISLLMNYEKVDTVYSRKSRLKRKIENSESPMKKFFLDNLD